MNTIQSKTVLITGGTGSFGRTVCEYLLRQGCKEIRILSRDELKQEMMRLELGDSRVKFYLGDIRDPHSLESAIDGTNLVFHAAALKQVPSCEFFPMQAVHTNISGSENVVKASIKYGVEKLLCLSTDKAVYPINAMGMSKALMEKVAMAASRGAIDQPKNTVICCVRYGNVMYSRGSAIPLFIRQITEGKPITLTNPSMTRFMMPLPEALDLVLFAFQHARPGDLFIKKTPACTLENLVQALCNLFNIDATIRQIGTRHGEKLYETLLTREELERAEDLGSYYRVPMDDRDLNYNKYVSEGSGSNLKIEDYHSHNVSRLSVQEIEALLLSLPEVALEIDRYRKRLA